MKRLLLTLVLAGLMAGALSVAAAPDDRADRVFMSRAPTGPVPIATPVAAGNKAGAQFWVDDDWAGLNPGDPAGTHVFGTDAFASIQAGIDAAGAGDIVNVFPGSYNETAGGRTLYDLSGPYQFGLFFGADKPGLVVRGVDAAANPITDWSAVAASVVTNATNSFGYSGFFVEADGVTISGLRILPNLPYDNKTIEVIGDAVTVSHCVLDIPEGGSIYLNDWRYDEGTNTSHLQSYTISGNRMLYGASVDLASGAGFSGPVSGRQITGNSFDGGTSYWALVSFNGSNTGVPWFLYSVGGAIITGNSFASAEQMIRARGTYDNAQFDWASYWNGNTFDRAACVGPTPPGDLRTYSYVSGPYTMNDVRRIGGILQGEVTNGAAGDVVLAKAGVYAGQLDIGKNLTLVGAGAGQSIIRAVPSMTAGFDSGSGMQHPLVYAHDAASVVLDGFTIDGDHQGSTNYKFDGVAFWNAGGGLEDCEVLRVMDAAFSGAQHGTGVYANSNAGSYTLALTNVLIDDFQKNGTALWGDGLTVALDNVTAIGQGPTGVTAQNGIQVGANGTIANCHVSGVHWIYPGSGTRWTATGVLLFGPATVAVSNTHVTECQTGIYYYDVGGSIAGCVVTGSTATPDGYDGIDIWTDPAAKAAGTGPRAVPLPFDEPASAGAGKANVAVAITNTTVTGVDQGLENTGIWAGGEGNIGLTVSGCTVTGWDYGVGTYDDFGGAVTAMCQGNTFESNRAYGFDSTTATPADARNCDWGDPTGPYHATLNPLGQGNDVSDHVLFDPWSGQPELTIVPSASGPINCGDVQTLAFHYAAETGAVGFKGYSVTVECTAPLTFGPTDVHFVTPPGVGLGFPQVTTVVAGQKYTVDYGIMLPVGFAYVGETDLFTVTFHPTGTGVGTVSVSDVVFRNLTNVTIPVVEPGPATITVDCDAPAGVTDIAAAPAHRRVDLTWSASPSGDVASYEIWRAKWHRASPAVSAYPEYDDYPDNAIPAHVAAYPPGAEWTLAATVPVGTLTYGDVGDTNRGVYYYEVFAIDTAGNPSLPAPAYDRATNYWLGDVKSEMGGDYDGRVYVADVSKLGAAYGQSVPLGGVNFQVDVGPTDDWSRVGIPLTDSVIDFEDLMVFAMNFDVVAPKAPPAGPAAPVALAWAPLDEVTWSLRLAEPCADLRGLNVAAVLPEGVVASVAPGEVLTRLAGPWFLRNIDAHGLDVGVAAFGASLAGSGELLRVTLPGPADLASITVKARDGDNRSLEVRLDATSTPDSPLAFRLAQNVPNPFNPLTKIAFTLPSAQAVRLEVYAMDGRRVATLLDESRGAGRHEVVWNGRDGDGKVVASGTYFCRLLAGPYSEVRKMVLMK